MATRAGRRWVTLLPAAAWLIAVALLPWWMGLPLWLLLAMAAMMFHRRTVHYATLCRRGLYWGLPGLLFATQRAMGGHLLAWGTALLGALVGYSLLALMESLLDRRVKYAANATPVPEWRELAMAPVGPPAHIIELSRVEWGNAPVEFSDPDGESVRYEARTTQRGRYVFAQGRVIERAGPRYCFGPGGRWFAARLPGERGDILWDRRTDHLHRLAGWTLSGWDGEQPWLARRTDGVPAPLHEVLGRGSSR
ncbi:hypothetical protein P5Y53_17385 [Dyella jiangningensis]|uniref:hypothetical protein n=1 Tax=Dyella jiangningensis TaxID=1379159 RepID=UPI0024102CD4|nr:hypothetical protein [Dyella jiangningensis]MDG2539454.1 hypothetical protein [Dyella jiangningensis]